MGVEARIHNLSHYLVLIPPIVSTWAGATSDSDKIDFHSDPRPRSRKRLTAPGAEPSRRYDAMHFRSRVKMNLGAFSGGVAL